jgi:hypothetical protein
LIVTLPGCPTLTLNAKSATIRKITYDHGKRIIFSHAQISNLQTTFVLIQGHGDPTVRASISFDFLEIVDSGDHRVRSVYQIEVGMDRPTGGPFGTLSLHVQIIPLDEFQEAFGAPLPTSTALQGTTFQRPAEPPRRVVSQAANLKTGASPTGKRIAVSRHDVGRAPSARGPPRPDWQLQMASRPQTPSIHERYMQRNELWIGHHCSTRTEHDSSRSSSRGPSELSSAGLSVS